MKKLFAIALLIAFTAIGFTASAQYVKIVTPTKTSLATTDTAVAVLPVTLSTKSVDATGLKTASSPGGKIYLQGQTLDGLSWVAIDSVSVTNVATVQRLHYKFTTYDYSAYRFQYISSGGTWTPKAFALFRQ